MYLDGTSVPAGASVELMSPRFTQGLGRVEFWYFMAEGDRELFVYGVDGDGVRGQPLWGNTIGEAGRSSE